MENQDKINPYSFPPGLLGEIGHFIHDAAPRPVCEIALAGAIGLMAGIVGRAYNVSNTGLNMYVLLLARTGTGKEAISSGVNSLMGVVRERVPAADEFIGPASIASSQALIKHLANTSSSLVSVIGEFGITMQQMAHRGTPIHLLGLKQILLDLFNKSGKHNQLRPSIYSDKEKNTKAVLAPAFTLVGESTPESFYDSLSEQLIADGLLPRFTIIEYFGDRPYRNLDVVSIPEDSLVENLSALCAHALMLNQKNEPIDVQLHQLAEIEFNEFDLYADDLIRGNNEVTRQLWNRAHIKALKLAALAAVGVNPYNPIITFELALWAIQIEKFNIRSLISRFDSGDVGDFCSEEKRIQKVINAFVEYVLRPWEEIAVYGAPKHLHSKRILNSTYIQRKLGATKAFRKDGATQPSQLIAHILKVLIGRGDIQEIQPHIMLKEHNFRGIGYMLSNPDLITSNNK